MEKRKKGRATDDDDDVAIKTEKRKMYSNKFQVYIRRRADGTVSLCTLVCSMG